MFGSSILCFKYCIIVTVLASLQECLVQVFYALMSLPRACRVYQKIGDSSSSVQHVKKGHTFFLAGEGRGLTLFSCLCYRLEFCIYEIESLHLFCAVKFKLWHHTVITFELYCRGNK